MKYDELKVIGVIALIALSAGVAHRRSTVASPHAAEEERTSQTNIGSAPAEEPLAVAAARYNGDDVDSLRSRIAALRGHHQEIEPIVGHYNRTAPYCAALSARYDSTWTSSSTSIVSPVVARCHYVTTFNRSSTTCGSLNGLPVYHAARIAAGISVSLHAPLFANRIRRNRRSPVLVVPTDAACRQPSGVMVEGASGIVPRRSLPSPTCDAFMTMWCAVLFNHFNETTDENLLSRNVGVWKGQEATLDGVKRLWLERTLSTYTRGRLPLQTMYPTELSPRTLDDNACTKSGHPAGQPRPGGKATRIRYVTAEAMSFVLRDVYVFRGNLYHKNGSGSILNHAPHFNKISGRWPSDVYAQRQLLPLEDLARAVAQSRANVTTINRPLAVWFPPTDMEGGYHVVADGLLNHFHAIRHHVARNESVAVVMQAAHRRSTDLPESGAHLGDCSIGWDRCLGPSNPTELKYVVHHIAKNMQNVFVTRPAGARSLRPAPASQSSTVLRFESLYLSNPSNCEPHGAIEANLLENFEGIQYSRNYLDCDTSLWVWRRMIFEVTRNEIIPQLLGRPRLLMVERRIDTKREGKLQFRTVGASALSTELLNLPDPDFLDREVDPLTEGIHIVMLFRSPGKSRSVPFGTRDAFIQRFERALSVHPLCDAEVHPVDAEHHSARCSIRFGTFGGLHDAALLLATATVAVMPHGLETLNIPLLRPNAIVVSYDSFVPLIVPFVPLWLHWQATVVDCAPGGSGKSSAKSCQVVNHLYVENKYRIRGKHMSDIVSGVLRMVQLQCNATTILWYRFQ